MTELFESSKNHPVSYCALASALFATEKICFSVLIHPANEQVLDS